jgi:MFS family permease
MSLLGDGAQSVALAFAVLDLTGSPTDLGYVLGAWTATLAVFLLVGGVVADRVSRRGVMVTADVVRFAGQGVMAVLLVSGRARLWELVALVAVHGAASAFFTPASTGMVPQTIDGERLGQANALLGLSMAAGNIAGPALGGLLVAGIGAGWAIGADSITFVVSAGLLVGLRPAAAHHPSPRASFLADFRGGWSEISARSWLLVIIVTAAVGNALNRAFFVLGPAIAKRSLGGAGAWGLIVSALGVGALLGGLVALRWRPQRQLLIPPIAVCAAGLPTVAMALTAPVLAIAGLALLAGGGIALFAVAWDTALQQHVPPAALSRVSAYDWFGSLVMTPVGSVVAGPVAGVVGLRTTLLVAGLGQIVILASCLLVPSVRNLRPVTDHPQ